MNIAIPTRLCPEIVCKSKTMQFFQRDFYILELTSLNNLHFEILCIMNVSLRFIIPPIQRIQNAYNRGFPHLGSLVVEN